VFVSANKNDFWAEPEKGKKGKTPTIHPDLNVEADAAGLQFFGKLDLGLLRLGV